GRPGRSGAALPGGGRHRPADRLRVEHGLPARPLPPQRCLHRLPRAGRAHPRLRPQPRATPLDQAGRPRTAQVALQCRHGRLTQPDLATVLPTTPGPRPDPHPGPGRPGPQTRPRGLRPDQASNPVSTPACWLRGNIESSTRAFVAAPARASAASISPVSTRFQSLIRLHPRRSVAKKVLLPTEETRDPRPGARGPRPEA